MAQRGWFTALLAGILAMTSSLQSSSQIQAADGLVHVFIGTYTGEKSRGIYRAILDLKTGQLKDIQLAAETKNPSFLAIHPSGTLLYAVGENAEFEGQPTGAVSAFTLDPKTGMLTKINSESSRGTGPCHLVVDKTGKNVLVANYGGGNIACLPIGAGGKLEPASAFIQHKGSSVNKQRQEAPHAHSINVDAGNNFAVAADLGLDEVLVYKFDAAKGSLTPNDPPYTKVAPGAGPRHFAFHPDGKHAYVINEITLTVTAFDYDADHGKLTEIQTISTLPEGTQGPGLSTAEVVVHPSGKFLYGSNRGHDTIAMFQIAPETGKLTTIGFQPAGVKTPRNFAIDPTGQYLIAGGQSSDTAAVFRIDPQAGTLQQIGGPIPIPSPVCFRMLPVAR